MTLRASDVFVPGAFPAYTYVERTSTAFERLVRDALDTPGQIVSLSGPSKSGKTVLIEKVVGREQLISISGASIKSADDVWDHVLNWMDIPTSASHSHTRRSSSTINGNAQGGVDIPFLAKGGATIGGSITGESSDTYTDTRQRRGLPQIHHEIADSDYVVLLDDFHYMPRDVQTEVAKTLKEAVRLGIKIITASVCHRGDDIVRANTELRGRVRAIDLDYWSKNELKKIAQSGFHALNVNISEGMVNRFATESAGSPQLMQLLCLNACFNSGTRHKNEGILPVDIPYNYDSVKEVFQQTSCNTDFRSLVDVLDAGPRTRGTERKTYKFHDHTEGDVYRVVLRAVSCDPPKLAFPYDELIRRVNAVCINDSPVGSSITGTCLHMSKLALEKFPTERALDWDEQKQVLDIPDPYLLFYLRWSERLSE